MSKISLQPNASGTGTFTLAAPDSNTNRTLTLPDEEGTVATIENIPPGYEDQDALDLFNVTGSAPVYACRAWVNFDGTGTVSIRASGNVSSVTKNSGGNYTINTSTALPDVNYAVTFGAPRFNPGNPPWVFQESAQSARTTTSFRMWNNQNGNSFDAAEVQIAIFR